MATTQTQLGWRRDVIVARDSLESGDAATAQPRASRQLNIIAKQKLKPFIPGLRPTPDWNHSRQDFDTDNASVGAIKHFERLALGKHLDGSRIFLYKASRPLVGTEAIRARNCATPSTPWLYSACRLNNITRTTSSNSTRNPRHSATHSPKAITPSNITGLTRQAPHRPNARTS